MITFRHYDTNNNTVSISQESLRFGYSVQLRMALVINRLINNVDSFDRGRQFDYRVIDFQAVVHKSEIGALTSFFRQRSANENVTDNDRYVMTVPAGSGFYPAGPDHGDSGDFVVSLMDGYPTYTAMQVAPFGFFVCKFAFVLHDLPATIYHSSNAKNAFESRPFNFGSVTGLRDPAITPNQEWPVKRSVTPGGVESSVSRTTNEYTTNITLRDTKDKIAGVVSFIQNSGRGYVIPCVTGKHYWLFGPDNEESGAVNVKLLDNTITMQHVNPNRWECKLALWRSGVPE